MVSTADDVEAMANLRARVAEFERNNAGLRIGLTILNIILMVVDIAMAMGRERRDGELRI